MTRRHILTIAGSLAIVLTLANCLTAGDRVDQPNVVYMMLDEIGYFELSCMGHKVLKTPNLDGLAAQGMRFTQCRVPLVACPPVLPAAGLH